MERRPYPGLRAWGLCCCIGCVPLLPSYNTACPAPPVPLQELVLRSQLHPAAMPLLVGLPHLARLTLYLPCERDLDTWSSASAVAAGLMPLLLGGPSLESVHIEFLHQTGAEHDDREPPVDDVQEGVLWMREQLQRLGRDPRMITMDT